ncbi:ABC transporter permease [Atopomonas sediminilitoris]|uniref:ABC transporter permease n=1 Tax=Atopomonas sediminilitoris TaxID=2919919 RepID=UPI001F4D9257|nr:FtsX-like permease family protein [Atopomonas sediminilitoris]MCJ8169036.1 ABC transporter permease [Atopomonas sediminilitoris]
MPTFALFRLALRLLGREIRASELQVLLAALVIAVMTSAAIGYLNTRLAAGMLNKAAEFLGADIVLSGTAPASEKQIKAGRRLGLKHAQTVEFASVIAGNDGLQLSSIKAVDDQYPLRGQLRSKANLEAPDLPAQHGPGIGEAWAEPRLLHALGIKLNDSVDVGYATVKVTRLLTYEPDRAGDFYSLSPRLLINLADLQSTGLIQPGSRLRYRELWSGDAETLRAYQREQEAYLAPHQQWLDTRQGNAQVGNALQRAERYLNLASLAALLLCGVAVALAAARFALRRYDEAALMRCMGLSRRQTLQLFCLQLATLGVLASALGALLGALLHIGLIAALGQLLPADLPNVGLQPALTAMATGLIALAGFSLPPLLALGRVPPLRVLRRDLQPLPTSAWLIYGSALAAIGVLMWRLSLDLTLTLSLFAGTLLLLLVLGVLVLLVLKRLRALLGRINLSWRLSLGQMLRQPISAAGQILAFALILMAMGLVLLLRNELLDTWQAQLPNNAPNHFALNVLPEQRDSFSAAISQISHEAPVLYPVSPGRLVAINQQAVNTLVSKDEPGDNALQRDLSLTWAAELPSGNRLTEGQWWDQTSQDDEFIGVSVESHLAKRLKIKLGDQLTFNIAGRTVQSQVSSLRELDWGSLQPNFYMVFAPGSLPEVPFTYLTSFHAPADNLQALLALSRDYPAITLLPIDALLAQLRSILAQVTLAVELVLALVLLAGVTVLLAGLLSTLDERLQQGAILRTLGASNRLLRRARWQEFALQGALAGLMAALGCELISVLLYQHLLGLPWTPHPELLLLVLLGALLISLCGSWLTRQITQQSPMTVLRELS